MVAVQSYAFFQEAHFTTANDFNSVATEIRVDPARKRHQELDPNNRFVTCSEQIHRAMCVY